MDASTRLREEAREHEKISVLEREEAKIDRLIAQEEGRRMDISKRLQEEIRRLEMIRRSN